MKPYCYVSTSTVCEYVWSILRFCTGLNLYGLSATAVKDDTQKKIIVCILGGWYVSDSQPFVTSSRRSLLLVVWRSSFSFTWTFALAEGEADPTCWLRRRAGMRIYLALQLTVHWSHYSRNLYIAHSLMHKHTLSNSHRGPYVKLESRFSHYIFHLNY